MIWNPVISTWNLIPFASLFHAWISIIISRSLLLHRFTLQLIPMPTFSTSVCRLSFNRPNRKVSLAPESHWYIVERRILVSLARLSTSEKRVSIKRELRARGRRSSSAKNAPSDSFNVAQTRQRAKCYVNATNRSSKIKRDAREAFRLNVCRQLSHHASECIHHHNPIYEFNFRHRATQR